ncbi:hypothetical protein ATCC90586_001231 [Pythium insidiosum]|nr:hypothetical protein ATCC90586_001231 [Pythium insidiosum]
MVTVHPVTNGASRSSAPSLGLRRNAWTTRLITVLAGNLHRRYTTSKFLALHAYVHRTSRWRLAGVISLFPVPSLLIAVLLASIPLQDPALGVARNWGFLMQCTLGVFVVNVGVMKMALASVGVPDSTVSLSEIAAIGALGTLQSTAAFYLFASSCCFPVPFTTASIVLPGTIGLVTASVLILRNRLIGPDASLRRAIASSGPTVFLQASQTIIYPTLSVLFKGASEWEQVLLALVLPVMKHILKRALRRAGHRLGEYSEEVAVSGVEIAASLYQTAIMQNATTKLTVAVIIGVDVLQGLLVVRLFMDKTSTDTGLDQRDLVCQALELLRRQSVTEATLLLTAEPMDPSDAMISAAPAKANDAVRVRQALEIAQVAENILLTEYYEVALPVVNGLFLALAVGLEWSRYHPTLCGLQRHPGRLARALQNLALYSGLQGLTVVLMMLVMQKRYRLSSLAQLAFVLERHMWSLQGKLLVWLPTFFFFSVVHYGTTSLLRKAKFGIYCCPAHDPNLNTFRPCEFRDANLPSCEELLSSHDYKDFYTKAKLKKENAHRDHINECQISAHVFNLLHSDYQRKGWDVENISACTSVVREFVNEESNLVPVHQDINILKGAAITSFLNTRAYNNKCALFTENLRHASEQLAPKVRDGMTVKKLDRAPMKEIQRAIEEELKSLVWKLNDEADNRTMKRLSRYFKKLRVDIKNT